jgi:hypothetical protein
LRYFPVIYFLQISSEDITKASYNNQQLDLQKNNFKSVCLSVYIKSWNQSFDILPRDRFSLLLHTGL